jgi:hypothetical protein
MLKVALESIGKRSVVYARALALAAWSQRHRTVADVALSDER